MSWMININYTHRGEFYPDDILLRNAESTGRLPQTDYKQRDLSKRKRYIWC